MPRAPRSFVRDAYYHLVARGSNRQAISITDGDKSDFVACLDDALTKHEVSCLAYCVMPNHYRLVLRVPDDRVSRAIKQLNGRYSLRFNRRYQRDAHLFKNRFRATLLDTESHFLWACGYTVANPVRAGLCARPEEWPWSSFRASVGAEPTPRFLAVSELLAHFDRIPDRASARYRALVSTCAGALSSGVGI